MNDSIPTPCKQIAIMSQYKVQTNWQRHCIESQEAQSRRFVEKKSANKKWNLAFIEPLFLQTTDLQTVDSLNDDRKKERTLSKTHHQTKKTKVFTDVIK